MTPGAKRAHAAQVGGGWEAAHVHPDLGDEHVGGGPADPGDLIQLVDRSRERGDLLGDLGLQCGDVDADLVDAGQLGPHLL